MPDTRLPLRLRRSAVIRRGEKAIDRAARTAIRELGEYARQALEASSMNAEVLTSQHPEWQRIVDEVLMPVVRDVFDGAYRQEATTVTAAAVPYEVEGYGSSVADLYAGQYLTGARNRLVGVSDTVFARIAATLQEGREAVYTLPDGQQVSGESIPMLSQRVDALLDDADNWAGRATTIARTEVISANNAGARTAAAFNADVLGYSEAEVVKEWLATSDGRTRETHLEVDGQQVLGLETPFVVGGYDLLEPGDPNGPGEEVINCRCTALYHYPGDAGYPDGITASATLTAAPPRQETEMSEQAPETPPETPVEVEVEVREDLPEHEADTNIVTEDCPCMDLVVFDTGNGWQRLDGSYSHDDGTVHSDWIAPPPEEVINGDATEADPEDEQATSRASLAEHLTAMFNVSQEEAERMVAATLDALPEPYAVPEPGEAPDGGPALAQDIPTDGEPFYGILWPEGVVSGDARAIDAGATIWRDLPLPIMVQDAQAPGHDGAVRAGRINDIVRDDTTYAVPVLRYTGNWDTSETAREAARQVDAGVARGLSVDGDRVTVELRGSNGTPLDPMTDEFPEDGVVIEAATEARVAGATICSIPAFQQAYIANGTLEAREDPEPGWNEDGTPKDDLLTPAEAADVPEGAVAASAWSLVASGAPSWSSADFQNPGLTEPTRLTVTDDGRVYGHLAVWGTCHIGIDGICQEPPASATNYAYFATGSVPVEDGMLMPVGQLTMETGHAGMNLRHRAAAAHYDNTGTAVAYVAMGQDGIGIWYAGRLAPGTTDEQVFAMRAAGAVSGDWREVGGSLELVAGLVVNVPGFPIPAASVAASGARAVAMVASGVVTPDEALSAALPAGEGLDGPEGRRALVDAVEANLALRSRARQAQARVRAQRAATARRRLTAYTAEQNRNRVAAAAARLTKGA